MSIQSQPDLSSSRPSELGTAEDRLEASAVPDTNHLWLVSEGGVAIQGGCQHPSPGQGSILSLKWVWLGPQLAPGKLVFAATFWAFWALAAPRREGPCWRDNLYLKFLVPALMRDLAPCAWKSL